MLYHDISCYIKIHDCFSNYSNVMYLPFPWFYTMNNLAISTPVHILLYTGNFQESLCLVKKYIIFVILLATGNLFPKTTQQPTFCSPHLHQYVWDTQC